MAASVGGHPSRTLEYFGFHAAESRSLRLEIRSERESISPGAPISRVTQRGGSFGGSRPSAAARESTYSRCRTGSSSDTLYTPAGSASAAAAAVAASSWEIEERNAEGGPGRGAKPRRSNPIRSTNTRESGP